MHGQNTTRESTNGRYVEGSIISKGEHNLERVFEQELVQCLILPELCLLKTCEGDKFTIHVNSP